MARQDQQWEERRDERNYDRSRSPRREGRGRYNDRDREGYVSPRRERSRSRSPYFGGTPNRNVILEGLPLDLTQEDVGRPNSYSISVYNNEFQSHIYPKCTLNKS